MRSAFSLLVLGLTISVIFGRSIKLFNHDDSKAIDGENLLQLPLKNAAFDDEDPFEGDSFLVNMNIQQSKNGKSVKFDGNSPTSKRWEPLVNEYLVDPFEILN